MDKRKAKPAAKRLADSKKPRAPTAPKPDTDWAGVELAVTTSARTYDDIGAEFGVSKGRISQKAKEKGWVRGSLMDRVRARAAEKVAAAEAHESRVEAGTPEAVEVSATVMAETIQRQRKRVQRLLNIADSLTQEVERAARQIASGKPIKLKKGEQAPDPLSVQLENLRKAGLATTQLVNLEREVMNIHGYTPIDPAKGIDEALANTAAALKERFAAIDQAHRA